MKLFLKICQYILVGLFGLLLSINVNQAQAKPDATSMMDWTRQLDDRAAAACPALPAATGTIVNVSTMAQLDAAVDSAASGTTILMADGTYNLNNLRLEFDTPNVTLRSASGNRENVIIDGNYVVGFGEMLYITASNVTIADITIRESYYHPIHVVSDGSHVLNTLIYNVHIIDPGEQAIKINPMVSTNATYFTDNGVVACSNIELTAAGRTHIRNNCYTGGVDAHQSRGWVIRDNRISGFWCASGLSEHAVHMWVSCNDTLVERNLLINNARGVGLGLITSNSGKRTYPDDPCPYAVTGFVDDYGGVVRNNMIVATDSGLFASSSGFDLGIGFWNACNSVAYNNTIYTTNTAATFSSIEGRFANTYGVYINNLVNDTTRFNRDGATYSASNNVTNAQASWFVNVAAFDLHLVSTATAAIDAGMTLADNPVDFDFDSRPSASAYDIGADEYLQVIFTDFLYIPIIRK